jgi:hypothetical protein
METSLKTIYNTDFTAAEYSMGGKGSSKISFPQMEPKYSFLLEA